jgi:hypothetical protein
MPPLKSLRIARTRAPEVYRGFGFPGPDDLGNIFQFKRNFQKVFCGSRDLGFSGSLNPSLQTFETWLARNKGRIPLGQTAGA